MKQTKREPVKHTQHSKAPVKKKRNILNLSIVVLAAALILIVGTQVFMNMPSSQASSKTSQDGSVPKNMKKNEYGGYGSYKFIANADGNGGHVEFIDVPNIQYSYFGNLDNTFSTMFLQDINAYRQNKGLNTLSRVSNVSNGKTVNFEYPDINKIAVLYGADTEDKLAQVVLKKFLETPENAELLNSSGSNIYLNTMVTNNNMTIVIKIAYEDTNLPAPISNSNSQNTSSRQTTQNYQQSNTRSNSYASTNSRQTSNYNDNRESSRERDSSNSQSNDNTRETRVNRETRTTHEARATHEDTSRRDRQDSNDQQSNNR